MTRDIKELDIKILEKSISQDTLIKALVTLIIVHNLSFYVVKWLAFYTFY
jgi:hypothetical protein